MNMNKICKICGDKARSFNFSGLPSCPSCRVFFYRNAAKHDKLVCRREGNCEIDFITRKCCPKCRMDKCFVIGMRLKPVENAEKYDLASAMEHTALSSDDNSNDNNISKIVLENALDSNIRDKLFLSADDDDLDRLKRRSSIKSIIKKHKNTQNFDLNQYELEQIEEIRRAMNIFENETTLPIVGLEQGITYLSKMCTAYSRRIIKFCKSIPFFVSLNQDDQLVLLKPFCFEIACIRAAFNFNRDTRKFIMLADETGTGAILIDTGDHYASSFLHLKHWNIERFAKLNEEMEDDGTIMILLCAILLAKPFTSDKTCLESVRYQYFVYCHLFRRYLESKYRNIEAADLKYTILLQIVQNDLSVMKENMRNVLIEYGVDQVAELIAEVLSLKD